MARLDRRTWLGGVAGACAATLLHRPLAHGADTQQVDWLAEIQKAPAKLPANAPKLAPLLVDSDNRPITTRDGWEERRKEIRQWWLDFLGPMPAERRGAPKWKVLEEDRVDNVIRQRIEYEVEPGVATQAYLCKPAAVGEKRPGIVALHSTVQYSIYQPAGLQGPPEKWFGLDFAKLGYVTISPRNYLWPDNDHIAAQQEAAAFLKRHPKTKGMAKMLHDAQVAVDLLVSLPEVDGERLGAVGHSLGAKEAIYLPAFDERIKVAVSSEGGIGTKFSNWDALWYLGPTIKEPSFTHEQHELLALCAPRPFLLIGGDSADGDRGWPFIEAALPVYKLYGEPAAMGQWNHRQGHAVPPQAVERIREWFTTYLPVKRSAEDRPTR